MEYDSPCIWGHFKPIYMGPYGPMGPMGPWGRLCPWAPWASWANYWGGGPLAESSRRPQELHPEIDLLIWNIMGTFSVLLFAIFVTTLVRSLTIAVRILSTCGAKRPPGGLYLITSGL